MGNLELLCGAGFIAGAMNAIAGGGSFVSFPALVFAGLPSVDANASSAVALFPGSLTSSWAYRGELAGFAGVSLGALAATSVVGGAIGAILLLATPQSAFDGIIPWLLLLAAAAFAGGQRAGAALRRVLRIGARPVLAVQFLLAIYGGYFGGAVGIMMMAVWSLLGSADLKAMNPAKTILVAATNTVAVLCFALAGAVWWREALAMMVAGAIGGYVGARIGRRLDPRHLRLGVTLLTVAMTVIFFWRQTLSAQ
jgi:uncharacterized protein